MKTLGAASPLVIGTESYLCVPLHAGAVDRLFRLVKLDDSGDFYYIHNDKSYWGCDCADFMYRRDGLDPNACKHVRAVRELLGPEVCPTWTESPAADPLMQQHYSDHQTEEWTDD